MTRGRHVYHEGVIGREIIDKEFAYKVCQECGEKAVHYMSGHSRSWDKATEYLRTLESECEAMHGERFEGTTRDLARGLDRLKREADQERVRLAELRRRI